MDHELLQKLGDYWGRVDYLNALRSGSYSPNPESREAAIVRFSPVAVGDAASVTDLLHIRAEMTSRAASLRSERRRGVFSDQDFRCWTEIDDAEGALFTALLWGTQRGRSEVLHCAMRDHTDFRFGHALPGQAAAVLARLARVHGFAIRTLTLREKEITEAKVAQTMTSLADVRLRVNIERSTLIQLALRLSELSPWPSNWRDSRASEGFAQTGLPPYLMKFVDLRQLLSIFHSPPQIRRAMFYSLYAEAVKQDRCHVEAKATGDELLRQQFLAVAWGFVLDNP